MFDERDLHSRADSEPPRHPVADPPPRHPVADSPPRHPVADSPPRHPAPGGPLDRLRPWIAWFGAGRLLGGAVAVVAVVIGGWWLVRAPVPPTEARLPFASAPSSTSPSAEAAAGDGGAAPSTVAPAADVVVHVAGAVVAPGVYELAPGSRVHAAVEAAGGARAEADTGALNLAATLVDGERIYVPVAGETVAISGDVAAGAAPAAPGPSGPLDINRATVAELDELPGIGPATAQAIVTHREQNGPFATVDDLEAVRGIGPAKLEAIRDLVRS